MRNFHITAAIDGRKTPLSGGPRAWNGGFSMAVNIREDTKPKVAVIVEGGVRGDGKLDLQVKLDPRFIQIGVASLLYSHSSEQSMPTLHLLGIDPEYQEERRNV